MYKPFSRSLYTLRCEKRPHHFVLFVGELVGEREKESGLRGSVRTVNDQMKTTLDSQIHQSSKVCISPIIPHLICSQL